jgi:hypothetical protein
MKFACPDCGQNIEAPDEADGQYIDCPSCSHNFSTANAAPFKEKDEPPPSAESAPAQKSNRAVSAAGQESFARSLAVLLGPKFNRAVSAAAQALDQADGIANIADKVSWAAGASFICFLFCLCGAVLCLWGVPQETSQSGVYTWLIVGGSFGALGIVLILLAQLFYLRALLERLAHN